MYFESTCGRPPRRPFVAVRESARAASMRACAVCIARRALYAVPAPARGSSHHSVDRPFASAPTDRAYACDSTRARPDRTAEETYPPSTFRNRLVDELTGVDRQLENVVEAIALSGQLPAVVARAQEADARSQELAQRLRDDREGFLWCPASIGARQSARHGR